MGKQKIDYSYENQDHLLENPEAKKPKSIRSSKLRWLALALACLFNLGNYFCFDNPQALQSYLVADLGLSGTQFDLLYSVYSFPNIVLPLFGGLIIDKIGVRVAVITFASLLILGQLIVMLGAIKFNYTLMIIGRVIFGLGGESLSVSQSTLTAKWFMGRELSFAMGLTLSVSRLGSSLNSFASPKIYTATGNTLYAPFLVGVGLCVFSWIGGFILTFLDKKADEAEGTSGEGTNEADTIRLADLKKLSLVFYLLLFNCFFLYGAYFGLSNNLNDLMVSRFGFTPDTAGDFIPIIYLCSATITPFFGMFTDYYGKRVLFMLVSSVVFLGDHLLIAFLSDATQGNTNYGMIGALVGIGIFYSTYAAIFWPCVPLAVQEKVTGTAFGIITALQNMMLAVIPLIIGAIHDGTVQYKAGYFWTEILLAGVTCVGICITTILYFVDMRSGRKLDRPGSKRNTSSKSSIIKSFG